MATEEFEGPISITADFGHNTLTGCTDCLADIRISGERLYSIPGQKVEEPPAFPADRELHFGRMKIGPGGTFESATRPTSSSSCRILRFGSCAPSRQHRSATLLRRGCPHWGATARRLRDSRCPGYRPARRQPAARVSASEQNQRSPRGGPIRVRA